MLVIFGPVLAFGLLIVMLTALAATLGWHSDAMRFIATAMGALVMLMTVALLYHQTSARKAGDRALQNALARVGDIVESAMDAIITVDEGQRIVLFNAAAERVFRLPRSAVLGQPLDMLIPERLRDVDRRHVAQFGETGETSRRMGDKTVLVGLRADSIRSEARLQGILDSAMDAIITVDENEHIVLFNAAAEAVFGCPREEALGAPLSSFIPERYRAAHSGHIKRFAEAGVTSRLMGAQLIVMGLRRSGEEFPIEASISQISDHGSKFFTVILRDVTGRVRAEEALRQSKEELRELGAAAHSVREQEKSRIARELHDELAQSLTSLKMELSAIKDQLAPGQERLARRLETLETLLDGMVTATRRIAADLRPLMLDDLGLVPATEWLVQNFAQRTGVHCELSVEPPELDLHDPHATAIYRILQESLTNVARHARASLVEVTLDGSDGEVVLRVRDNGRGFAPADPRPPNSFGLVGLRERVYLLDGEINVDSAPGKGTSIEVRIPLPSAAATP